jgi:hypothetical protein
VEIDLKRTISVWPKGKKQKLNSHRKSAAMDHHEPLPLWLTSHRARPALRAPMWTRLLRALRGSTQAQAVRPMPWHHDLNDHSRSIELPDKKSSKSKAD